MTARMRDYPRLPIAAVRYHDGAAEIGHDCPLCGDRFWRGEGERTPRMCPPCVGVVGREMARDRERRYYEQRPKLPAPTCHKCGAAIPYTPPGRPPTRCIACVPPSVAARRRRGDQEGDA